MSLCGTRDESQIALLHDTLKIGFAKIKEASLFVRQSPGKVKAAAPEEPAMCPTLRQLQEAALMTPYIFFHYFLFYSFDLILQLFKIFCQPSSTKDNVILVLSLAVGGA